MAGIDPKAPQASIGADQPLIAAVKDLIDWVRALRRGSVPLPIYTTTTLPTSSDYEGRMVGLSNGAGNRPIAVMVNNTWRYADGGAV